MIHRWYWVHANNGNPNVQNRMSIRTPLMQGPIYIVGMYHGPFVNSTMDLRFGYVEGAPVPRDALGNPLQPPTNGQGQFLETVFAPVPGGNPKLPPPPFTIFDHALCLQDDTKVFNATELNGFVPGFTPGNAFQDDYIPIRSFVPIWAGCICLSCTFTSIAGTGQVDVAFEVIEDVLNIPPEIRDALKGSDLFDFLSRLTDVALNQNSLINLFPFLWSDPIFQPYPNPVVPDLAKLYLQFLEAF